MSTLLAGHKRSRASEDASGETSSTLRPVVNFYAGYTFNDKEHPPVLDRVPPNISAQRFFQQYVAQRRPCVLTGLPDVNDDKPLQLTPDMLRQVAGSSKVQVEKRPDTQQLFGQNRTSQRQVSMTVQDFCDCLKGPDRALYYLSTQQQPAANIEARDEPFAAPCRQLLDAGYITATLPVAANLILSSCNLWMGAALASSSGLHHDYHDNLYLLLHGRKQFRLYAPCDAEAMHVYGSIQCVHANGLISYQSNPCRADGSPLLEDDNDEDRHNDDGSDDDDDDSDEEEVVLGKGFDYQSDDSDDKGDATFGQDEVDDYDDLVAAEEEEDASDNGATNATRRPDHFSPIDPSSKQDVEQYPSYAKCRECIVELEAGQCLYIPAGWFHFVTSSCVQSTNPHMALNYWYHPPDRLDRCDNPYQGGFWKKK